MKTSINLSPSISRHLVVTGLATLAIGSGNVVAQTITDQYSFPQSITEIDVTGSLDYFDSNLGTLTGATLTFDSSFITQFTLENQAAQTQIFGFDTELFFSWSSTNPVIQSVLAGELQPAISGGSYSTGVSPLTPGQVYSYGPFTSDRQVEIDLADYLALFQVAGGGTFDINTQSMISNTQIGGGGNVDIVQTTTAGVGATIVYTYIPVPEVSSATLGMMACGLGGLRRRRSNA